MAREPSFLTPEETEYHFRTQAFGWESFTVVNFHGVEEISRPFRYEITLVRRAELGPVSLDSLLDEDATLAVAARDQPGMYLRHGIIEEAEEVDRTSSVLLYRVALVPRFLRARYRRRCRTFLESTLRGVVRDVLRNVSRAHPNGHDGLAEQTTDSSSPELLPELGAVGTGAVFRWDVQGEDASRLDESRLYQYVVQYNESDFDFVSRLLEEEGISYFFEHSAEGTTLWLTETPGRSSVFEAHRREPRELLFHPSVGALDGREEQVIRTFRPARRMRSRSVTMRDWHWPRSDRVLENSVPQGTAGDDLAGHFEYPGNDENTLADPCAHPARVRFERLQAERSLSEGTAAVRGMLPGRRIRMVELRGGSGPEHLVTRVEVEATQLDFPGTALDDLPFGFDGRSARAGRRYLCRFQALARDVPYRPARLTPRPRIDGVQTAVVTDQEGDRRPPPEIHTDDWARVRVRFPWDQREDGRASSKWIRVSQHWAGAGFGALYIPRVGQEVLVAYYQGDPDRPAIVGRVYNQTNPLPLQQIGQRPERSTLRSQSTPDAEGYNEIRFDDRAHHEEIRVHAQRNLTEIVCAAHSTSVGGSQSNTVGGNQTNHVHGKRDHTVEHDENDTVNGHRTVRTAGYHRSYAAANHELYSTNFYVSTGPGAHDGTGGDMQYKSATAAFHQQQKFEIHVGPAFISVESGLIRIDNGAGASITLTGGAILITAGSDMTLSASSDMTARAAMINLNP